MTLPSATSEVAKSSTTGGASSRGMPTQNGAVDSRRSRPPNGATSSEPGALTKWIEIRPAAAARSAHSPTRPTWPELRSDTAASPAAFAFSTPMSTACGATVWPKPEAAVDDGDNRRIDETLDRLVGDDVA